MQTIDRSKTQVSSTAGTYRKVAQFIGDSNTTGKPVRVLDFGAGLCEGTRILNHHESNYIDAWSLEPFAKRGVSPHFRSFKEVNGKFDFVVNNCVLNVIEDLHERVNTVRQMLSVLKDGGKAIIMVRSHSAVKSNKTNTPYSDGFVNSKGTFQRGFNTNELSSLVTVASHDVEGTFRLTKTDLGNVGVIVTRES